MKLTMSCRRQSETSCGALPVSKTRCYFQEKCLSLGVPPGPLVAELKAGREVVLDDGTLVGPTAVFEDSTDAAQVRFARLLRSILMILDLKNV